MCSEGVYGTVCEDICGVVSFIWALVLHRFHASPVAHGDYGYWGGSPTSTSIGPGSLLTFRPVYEVEKSGIQKAQRQPSSTRGRVESERAAGLVRILRSFGV